MKKIKSFLLFNVFFFLFFTIHAQLELQFTRKVCLESSIANVQNIKPIGSYLLVQTPYVSKGTLAALNPSDVSTAWYVKTPAGGIYGLNTYQQGFYFAANRSSYDDVRKKPVDASMIYFAYLENGKVYDSLAVNYSILEMMPVTTNKTTGMIVQQDGKLKAVIVDVATGKIVHTLFTEFKQNSYDVAPVTMEIDPFNKFLAVGTANGSEGYKIYSMMDGTLIKSFPVKGDFLSLCFTSDSKYLLTLGGKKLQVVDLSSLNIEKDITMNNTAALMALHPDNENLLVAYTGNMGEAYTFNWKTGATANLGFNMRGGRPAFINNGTQAIYPGEGLECMVSSSIRPYLNLLTFSGSLSGNNNINSSTSYKPGDRIFALYDVDGKYYSATIHNINSGTFEIIYDDGYKAIVQSSSVKKLTPVRVGDRVQFRSSGKFYWATIHSVNGENVEVKYGNNVITSVSLKDIMQVSD